MRDGIFRDRTDAGQQLAQKLIRYEVTHPLILALPRGGVPVAFEVARVLNSPLDTLVVRKIGVPYSPEVGIGAIAPDDIMVLDDKFIRSISIDRTEIEIIIETEKKELKRRMELYRSGLYSKGVKAPTVIIVDDGMATGVTAKAAIEYVLKNLKPNKLVLAVPIAARDTINALDHLVETVTIKTVDDLMAIGYWYESFPQTTDEEVVELLEESRYFAK